MATNEPSSLSLEISRRFDAPPERVFDAWITEEWGAWLPPAGARCEVTELHPVVGGRYLVRMTMQDGRVVEISGVYRDIARPQRLVFTWTGNYNHQETVVTVTFRPDGEGTMMTLRQEGFPASDLRDGYKAGWTGPDGSFDKLARVLQQARRAAS